MQGERERDPLLGELDLLLKREREWHTALSIHKLVSTENSLCFQGNIQTIKTGRNFQLYLPACLHCFLGLFSLNGECVCSYGIRLHLHSKPLIHTFYTAGNGRAASLNKNAPKTKSFNYKWSIYNSHTHSLFFSLTFGTLNNISSKQHEITRHTREVNHTNTHTCTKCKVHLHNFLSRSPLVTCNFVPLTNRKPSF